MAFSTDVTDEQWATAFEDLLALRRRLRNTFGLPIRAEVKANHLIRSGGAFKQLAIAPAERHLIYRAHLNQLHKTDGVQAFAVMAHKSFNASAAEVLETAWIPMLQRLERASHYSGGQPVFVVHDEGENRTIRKLARRSWRRLTAGSLGGGGFTSHEFRGLVDDPFPKASHESYMLQLADLVAYAA